MSTIRCIDVSYIRPSRTIETISVTKGVDSKILYVYNYEGYSFRLFDSVLSLIDFFQNGTETANHFECEEELDSFLLQQV